MGLPATVEIKPVKLQLEFQEAGKGKHIWNYDELCAYCMHKHLIYSINFHSRVSSLSKRTGAEIRHVQHQLLLDGFSSQLR